MYINTRKLKGLDSRKITSMPEFKKVISSDRVRGPTLFGKALNLIFLNMRGLGVTKTKT